MEPANYFWKLLARELEEKQQTYRLVNAYTVKKHREVGERGSVNAKIARDSKI